MSSVLPPRSHSLPLGFAQLIAQRFGRGPIVTVGGNEEELDRQFRAAGIDASFFASVDDLPPAVAQNGEASLASVIWFYPRDDANDERAVEALTNAAETILLVPEPGSDSASRRPEMVRRFAGAGLLPDYDCDLRALEPGALR